MEQQLRMKCYGGEVDGLSSVIRECYAERFTKPRQMTKRKVNREGVRDILDKCESLNSKENHIHPLQCSLEFHAGYME
ncbi:hypothetical protein AB6A40_011457 [Gnathostoma spinigerum]|uniref:Uncharacterized protein n=1 Tax=Gnathostoma spinigerum TaxID=75299 RepID=A0ABD6F3J8_9BILA